MATAAAKTRSGTKCDSPTPKTTASVLSSRKAAEAPISTGQCLWRAARAMQTSWPLSTNSAKKTNPKGVVSAVSQPNSVKEVLSLISFFSKVLRIPPLLTFFAPASTHRISPVSSAPASAGCAKHCLFLFYYLRMNTIIV